MTKKQIIVVIAFALGITLFSVGLRTFVRPARSTSASNPCYNNLRQIEGAKSQWQLENSKTNNAVVTWSEILPYLGRGVEGEMPICPKAGTYILGRLDEKPRCSCGEFLSE